MLFPRKNIFLVSLFFVIIFNSFSQTEFITKWKTTTNNESITIPTNTTSNIYNVNWGDTTVDIGVTGNASHLYATPGTYTVTITGNFDRIFFNNTGDKDKIISIEQWGTSQIWNNMTWAFDGCSNVVNNATDVPNLSMTTNALGMFRNATSLGTGSAINWNSWDMSNIENIAQMFRDCSSFNGDISNWNVSKVTNFNNIFNGASSFNKDISGWKTTAVTKMNNTFRNAVAFDQNISSWDVSGVTAMNSIFEGATLSPTNYNALLIGWATQTLQPNIAFDGGFSKYCSADAIQAKANIESTYNWTFNDGGTVTSYIWTGITNSNWNDATNWQYNCGNTNNTTNVTIPNILNTPIIDDATTVNVKDLTIYSGALLTLEGAITVNGNLITNNGLAVSGGSIIVTGTSSGKLTYTRNIANGLQYYNIASPVDGETVENYINTNNLQEGNGNVGLYYYDNSTTIGFAGTAYVFCQPNSTGAIINGKGYGTQLATSGNIRFTGEMPIGDKSINILKGTIDNFNLIGNPFPSYIPINTLANSNNLLTNNSALLSEETFWFWDNTIRNYVTINQMTPAKYIAPAQGFFVDAIANGSFNFLASSQSHETANFYRKESNTTFSIKLSLKNIENDIVTTEIYFSEGKTTGFDNGYDSSQFYEGNTLNLYTRLVDNVKGRNLAIQTLPTENLENTIVPLGIKGNNQLKMNIVVANKPENITIYLEDTIKNTFIELKNLKDTFINLEESYNGIGRFFLHTSAEVLSTEKEVLNPISVFIADKKILNMMRLPAGNISLSIFDVLGKELHKEVFKATNSIEKRDVSQLKSGFYILHFKTEKGNFTKKLYI